MEKMELRKVKLKNQHWQNNVNKWAIQSPGTVEIIRTCPSPRWHEIERRVWETWEISLHGEWTINRDDAVCGYHVNI